MEQITNRVVMVRPANFGFNEETAKNNSFQSQNESLTSDEIAKKAIEEFDAFVSLLREHGVEVEVVQDTATPIKPDAIFPNNWFTTHEDKSVITYPMYAKLRQAERREDVLDQLTEGLSDVRRYGFEYFESEDKYLEGTGSMILDRPNKIVYACLSPRTHVDVLDKFAVLRDYKKIFFTSVDRAGGEVYHTNVIMTLGESFVVLCMESIKDEAERKMLMESLEATEKELVDISLSQVESFAGNMIQLRNAKGERFIVMSLQAKQALNDAQIEILERNGKILSPDITTIETSGGGSARCMIAENFLPIKE